MPDSSANKLFVGIGSPNGNDQVGWLAAHELTRQCRERGFAIDIRCAQIPVDLLDWMAGCEQLIICDACRFQGEPGTIYRWDWPELDLADARKGASHGWGLCEVLQLAQKLEQLPGSVVIWGIEMGSEPASMAKSVADRLINNVPVLVSRILAEIQYA